MKTIVFALLALFSITALAETAPELNPGDIAIQWTPPTARINGKPLDPSTEIASYELSCLLVGGDTRVNVSIPGLTVDGYYAQPVYEIFPVAGDYDCTLAAVDTDGLYSDAVALSNGPITVLPSKPKAPTSFFIFLG